MRYQPGPMTGERAPSRLVALDGPVNVRDIGGYRSVHGLEVIRGRLFRGYHSAADQRRYRTARPAPAAYRHRLPGPRARSWWARRRAALWRRFRWPAGRAAATSAVRLIASGDHQRQRRELGDEPRLADGRMVPQVHMTTPGGGRRLGPRCGCCCAPGGSRCSTTARHGPRPGRSPAVRVRRSSVPRRAGPTASTYCPTTSAHRLPRSCRLDLIKPDRRHSLLLAVPRAGAPPLRHGVRGGVTDGSAA